MSLTAAICDSAKQELLNAVHNFAGASPHTFKMALIKAGASGTWDKTTTNYGAGSGAPTSSNLGTDEVANGSGYTTGGVTLTGCVVSISGDTAYVDFTVDPSWSSASISAIGALIYNSSASNKAVAVLDFGGTITSTNGTFTVTLPAAGLTAVIRIA